MLWSNLLEIFSGILRFGGVLFFYEFDGYLIVFNLMSSASLTDANWMQLFNLK